MTKEEIKSYISQVASNKFNVQELSNIFTNILDYIDDSITTTNEINVEAKTSTYDVLTSDSGKLFTNEGATSKVLFNLPSAASGLNYKFYVLDTDGIDIKAASGDTINYIDMLDSGGSDRQTLAGGTITAIQNGSTLELVAINNTNWVAINVSWKDA